jgi:hypothetical protein
MKRTDTPAFLSITLYCFLIASANQCFAGNLNLNVWQDTILVNCPPSNTILGDTTDNDPGFWKETYWYNAPNQVNDLSEVAVDLQITVSDSCFGATDNIQYQLVLDLDGDDTLETIINSENLGSAGLGWNKVLFANAGIPNYTGVPRQFDERQVATNEKYGFALQITQTGQTRTAAVRWNTQADSNVYVLPQLPHGKHKIVWIIQDTCGNVQTCTSNFTIKDTQKPKISCLSGVSGSISPTQSILFWYNNFLQSAIDNTSPITALKFAIRKTGTGTGFPLTMNGDPKINVAFSCDELWENSIELWVVDQAGNSNYCTTDVTILDNNMVCELFPIAKIKGLVLTEADSGVADVQITATNPNSNGIPIFKFTTLTNKEGFFIFNGIPPQIQNVPVTPYKNDHPLNGVSTFDLVLISKHILGIEALNSPYKIIAADANKSNSVTSIDIVELRRLILGIYDSLPNITSWRFVDKYYVFPNPLNPFEATFSEISIFSDIPNQHNNDLIAVKVGDVNGNAILNASTKNAVERSNATLLLSTENRAIKAGETFTLQLAAAERVQAYQFTLNFQNLSLLNVNPLSRDMDLSNFGIFVHALTTSYNGAQAGTFELTFRAQADGQISDFLYLSDDITASEAYQHNQRMDIGLLFNGGDVAPTQHVNFEAYPCQPNPMGTATRIGVVTPREMPVKLEIFDLTGRLLYTQQGQFEKGYHQFTVNRTDLPENATGTLLYKIASDAGVITRKMIVLR